VRTASSAGVNSLQSETGRSPASLLDTYCSERRAASQENIRQSTRSTDFITPRFEASRLFRDATLSLAKDFPSSSYRSFLQLRSPGLGFGHRGD